MDIRDRIRQVLAQNPEWTPRSVSLKAGLSDSLLSKFLNPDKRGGVRSMSVDTLESVARALEVNPRWLIWGDQPAQAPSNLVHIWDRIPAHRRKQALRLMEAFVETDDIDESEAG